MNDDYIKLAEFAKKYDFNESHIINRIERKDDISGVLLINNNYYILKDSRYPYDNRHLKGIKRKSDNDIKYLILHATSLRRYIDHTMLGLEQKYFLKLINDLESQFLLETYETSNKFGANAYTNILKRRNTN